MEPSAQAPPHWRLDLTEAKVRELVLELKPDFVFFQELPGLVPYVETHDLVPANTISHSGNIATIAKKELMEDLESKTVGRFGVQTTIKSADLSLVNVHLEPGRTGDDTRNRQISEIMEGCSASGLVIAGDTNMRVAEEDALKEMGIVGERPPVATWNSRINHYREGGREYTSYYTRYLHNDRVKIDQVKVYDKPFDQDGKKFFLSDHFALSGRIKVLKESGSASSQGS